MIYRITYILLVLLSPCFASCSTEYWNKVIERQIHPDFDYSHNEFDIKEIIPYGVYRKGLYMGEMQLKGETYFRYIVPNAYKDVKKNFFEILVSATFNSVIVHTITSSDVPTTGQPVYFKYSSSNPKYIYQTPINPKYIQKIDHSAPHSFQTAYPSLIIMYFEGYGAHFQMKFGQRLKTSEYTSINTQGMSKGKHCISVCPETLDNEPALMKTTYQINENCEAWCWTSMVTSENKHGLFIKNVYNALRYIGYLITVPLDIITSPIWGPCWIFGDKMGKGFGGP